MMMMMMMMMMMSAGDSCDALCVVFQLLMKHSLVAALADMVPVKPRRQIVYPVDRLGANAPSDRILEAQEYFALNHVNRKLVLEPKVPVTSR